MKRAWLLPLLVLSCQGRELTVFEVVDSSPAAGSSSGGTAPSPDSGGSAGSGGAAIDGGTGGLGGTGDTGGTGDLGGAAGTASSMPDGGEPSFPNPESCVADADCDISWVCEKPGCDATVGRCVPWPPICWDDPMPVCGCDGVTYWNDCVRLKSPSHPQLAGFGPCRDTAQPCQFGPDCNVPYASCSHLMAPGAQCKHGAGSCWVLPPQCTPSSDKRLWRECRPPEQGPPPCLSTCEAIASERPHAELRSSETCN